MINLLKKRHFCISGQRGSLIVVLPLLLSSVALMAWSRGELRQLNTEIIQANADSKTPLYLPEADKVRLLTLGFDNFASDILWFGTLNYFGKQYDSNKDLRWFAHMCDVVSSLDPKAEHVYEFCVTLLSWVAKRPEESARLIEKAIANKPDYWRYHYLKGFTQWYFLERKDLAQQTLSHASTLKDAPPFLASLATRLMVAEDSPATAIRFLKDLLANTKDETAKAAFKEKLNLAYISRDIRYLRSLCEKYQDAFQRKPESFAPLVEKGMLKGIPLDPYRAPYAFELDSCEVRTTSGKKGLEFFGKTAKTGLAGHE